MEREVLKACLPWVSCPMAFIIIIQTLIFTGCGQRQKEDGQSKEPTETENVAAYRKEVIAVHDDAMNLMSDIYQLKNQLKEKLQAGDALSNEDRTEVEVAIARLDSASQGMRVWMREFGDARTTGVSEEEALSNLKAEMEKITKVKYNMTESVAAAKALQ
jgi:hypothetical protein